MPLVNLFHGIEYALIADQSPPIQTLKSSVIGLVGTAGKGPVNTPVALTGGRREAARIFGEFHMDGFSIPEALDAIFDQGSATVVVINVCDPATMNTAIVSEALNFNPSTGIAQTTKPYHTTYGFHAAFHAPVRLINGQVRLPATGISNIVVQTPDQSTTYVLDTDYHIVNGMLTVVTGHIAPTATIRVCYTIDGGPVLGTDFTYDASSGTFTRVASGSKIIPNATVHLDYTYVDPTQVTETLVIGTVSEDSSTGIQALPRATAAVQLKPRLICAPRFTQAFSATDANAVTDALDAVSLLLGGRAFADAPNLDKVTAVNYAQFFAGPTRRTYIHYPNLHVSNPDVDGIISQPASARICGLISAVDNSDGFWNSPSNRELAGVLGIDKQLTYGLSDKETDVQYLNTNGVATTVFDTGFRLFGNRQANMQFLSTNRICDIINESIVIAHLWALDKNITKGLVEQVIEGVRAYLRILETRGAILPNPQPSDTGDVWADPELNTPDTVANGELYISYRFNPPTPAEHIIFQAHMTRDYVVGIFQ